MNENTSKQIHNSIWYFLQLYFLPICVVLISMLIYVNLFYFICVKENNIDDVKSTDIYEIYI